MVLCMTRFKAQLLAAALLCGTTFMPAGGQAHPHVWVTGAATLKFDSDKLVKVGMRWTFDTFFSQVLTGDFDKDKDGKFSPEETKAMFDQVFTSLKDYGFFTHFRVDDNEVLFSGAENFSTALDNGDLVYVFDLILAQPIDPAHTKVQFAVFDPTIYVDIILGGDKPVTIEGAAAAKCKADFSTAEGVESQGAFITPQLVTLTCA
jgi:ABC-type uncharacterized transport system substrate-binding protein